MCLLYVYVIWQCSNNYPFCALTYTRTCLVQCPEWQSHWSVMRGDVLPYRLGHMNFWTYKVYLNEINSSYEKSYRGLRIHLPLINVICTKVGGAIPLPYAYFVNKTSINYPSVHHLVLSRLHQMSPPPPWSTSTSNIWLPFLFVPTRENTVPLYCVHYVR